MERCVSNPRSSPPVGKGETATAEEMREFCKGKIAHFKIPRYVHFVDEFPTTVTGKLQKFRMREIAIEQLKAQAEPARASA